MFRYLFLLVTATALWIPGKARGQASEPIENDIFYQIGGGARLRYLNFRDSTGGLKEFEEDYQTTSTRLQFDLRLDKGEYFQTYFRAINTGQWGGQTDDQNEFTLQQAWANWKVADFLSLKFGRQPLEIGRGLVYGLNEWQNLPSYYDGFTTMFDWSVMELSLHALRIYELDRIAGSSVASDPEVTHYIVNLNFKDLSDMVQMADLYFIQVIGDVGQIPNTTTLTQKERVQRFGLDVVLSGVYFQFSNTFVYVAGTSQAATAQEQKVKQIMADTEVRFMMPDWEQLNFWVGGHYDSGDDVAGDDKNAQYDPLFYNIHHNAGRLDFFKFGNLTYLRSGFSMHMLSDYYFGAEYFIFQKTKAAASNFLTTSISASDFLNGVYRFGNDKDLGKELDIWVGKKFRSGVSVELSFNFLDPGQALAGTTEVASGLPAPIDSSIFNIYLDVGIFF